MYFLRPNLYTIYTRATARCIFLDPICTQFILELRLDFFSYLRYRYLLAKMIIFLTLLEPTKFLDRFLLKTKSKILFFFDDIFDLMLCLIKFKTTTAGHNLNVAFLMLQPFTQTLKRIILNLSHSSVWCLKLEPMSMQFRTTAKRNEETPN